MPQPHAVGAPGLVPHLCQRFLRGVGRMCGAAEEGRREQGISPGVMECCTELKLSTANPGEADGVGAVDAPYVSRVG